MARSSSDLAAGVEDIGRVDLAASESAAAKRATRGNLVARVDRLLLWGMAIGVFLMLQPVWASGLQVGFFVTLVSTVLEIVTGHLLPEAPRS